MSRATAALPPGLRRSKRRAVLARRLPRPQPQRDGSDDSINEDEEPITEVESDDLEGLQALHSGPPAEGLPGVRSEPARRALHPHIVSDDQRNRQRESEVREELLARYSGQVPRGPDRPSSRRSPGQEIGEMGVGGAYVDGRFCFNWFLEINKKIGPKGWKTRACLRWAVFWPLGS